MFLKWDEVVGEAKERALRIGLGHVCSSFDESVGPQKIIDEMRGGEFSTGKGELFEPCEQYEFAPWEVLLDTVELIARDAYEFACSIYEEMPQYSARGVHLFQDMCTAEDVQAIDDTLTWEQCDEIAGGVFRPCDCDIISEAVFLATNQEDDDE